MSLQSLAELRRSGKAPTVVWVAVGDKPGVDLEGPDFVHIRPSDDVRHMDFRPLFGLHVDLIEVGDHKSLMKASARAVDAAKPRSTGVAMSFGVQGLNGAHEDVLRQAWELMQCK